MNIKVFLAGMSIAIAMTLSCGLKMREAKAQAVQGDPALQMMCHHVPYALEATQEYGDQVLAELRKFAGRDDTEAQVRRGVLYPLLEEVLMLRRIIKEFDSENCAVH